MTSEFDQGGETQLIGQNVAAVQGPIFQAIALECMGILSTLEQGGAIVPYDEVGRQRSEAVRLETQEKLDNLPHRTEQVVELIEDFKITTPLDVEFVQEACEFFDLQDILPEHRNGEEHGEAELTFVIRALESLRQRIAVKEAAAAAETSLDAELSGSRSIKIIINGEQDAARMELPFVHDPNEYPVALGPLAVVEILGAPLSDADYQQIYNVLMSLEGPAGEAVRNYSTAVDAWAKAEGSSLDDPPVELIPVLRARRLAAREVSKLFNFSPHTDIPLNAILVTVMRKYPAHSGRRTPQPYEN